MREAGIDRFHDELDHHSLRLYQTFAEHVHVLVCLLLELLQVRLLDLGANVLREGEEQLSLLV